MDLSALNFEQLGTAGIFIAFQIWLYIQKCKELLSEKEERRSWQEKAFTISREAQSEISDSVKTLDKAMELLRGQS